MNLGPGFDPHSLPELQAWDLRTGGAGLVSYVGQEGSFAHALATLWLVTPDLVEVRGCVLLRERYVPRNFEHWWDRLNGDTRRIEYIINLTNVGDIFNRGGAPEEALDEFTVRLAQLWRCVLPEKVRTRRFEVDVMLDPEQDGPYLSFSSWKTEDGTPPPATL